MYRIFFAITLILLQNSTFCQKYLNEEEKVKLLKEIANEFISTAQTLILSLPNQEFLWEQDQSICPMDEFLEMGIIDKYSNCYPYIPMMISPKSLNGNIFNFYKIDPVNVLLKKLEVVEFEIDEITYEKEFENYYIVIPLKKIKLKGEVKIHSIISNKILMHSDSIGLEINSTQAKKLRFYLGTHFVDNTPVFNLSLSKLFIPDGIGALSLELNELEILKLNEKIATDLTEKLYDRYKGKKIGPKGRSVSVTSKEQLYELFLNRLKNKDDHFFQKSRILKKELKKSKLLVYSKFFSGDVHGYKLFKFLNKAFAKLSGNQRFMNYVSRQITRLIQEE